METTELARRLNTSQPTDSPQAHDAHDASRASKAQGVAESVTDQNSGWVVRGNLERQWSTSVASFLMPGMRENAV